MNGLFEYLGKLAAITDAIKSVASVAPKAKSLSSSGALGTTSSIGNAAAKDVREGLQNILPARALGGSTSTGVKQLYQSTIMK